MHWKEGKCHSFLVNLFHHSVSKIFYFSAIAKKFLFKCCRICWGTVMKCTYNRYLNYTEQIVRSMYLCLCLWALTASTEYGFTVGRVYMVPCTNVLFGWARKFGALKLRPPTNWPRNILTHLKRHWTFRPLWQFTTVTFQPCDIYLLWHFAPHLIGPGN
jgi:hypothetical protein